MEYLDGRLTIHVGDCLDRLREMPDESVDCCVTSPPYFGLRDYGHEGQIGLEPTPQEFVAKLVAVFREVRRVLKPEGTCWVNLGDSYAGGGGFCPTAPSTADSKSGRYGSAGAAMKSVGKVHGVKSKDLIGIPWMVAFALRDDGWYLRQEIIWHKPNPMPESVRDRCTKAHEHVFLLTKSPRYFFDQEAIKEPAGWPGEPNSPQSIASPYGQGFTRKARAAGNKSHKYTDAYEADETELHRTKAGLMACAETAYEKRNKRSVWNVSTLPYAEAHFATFPPALVEPMILAGCPRRCCSKCGKPWTRITEREDTGFDGSRYGERAVAATGGAKSGGTAKSTLGSSNGKLVGRRSTTGFEPSCSCDAEPIPGVVLDPFGGAGTTALVALRHSRKAVLIELNPEYADMAARRITTEWRAPVRKDGPIDLGPLFADQEVTE